MIRFFLKSWLKVSCAVAIMFPLLNFIPAVLGLQSVKAQDPLSNSKFFDSFPKDSLPNGAILTFDEPIGLQNNMQKPVKLVLYALPNGSTMEAAFGRHVQDPNQYVFESQHIGAQTRFIRQQDTSHQYVVVYIGNLQKSWPAWVKSRNEAGAKPEQEIASMVTQIQSKYAAFKSTTYLTGHSGGGRFMFSWIDAFKKIPSSVERIVFFDATYGYETKKHQKKLKNWLAQSSNHQLDVISYNDSVVVFRGKPLVSPTGGTWYRSQMMAKDLSLPKTKVDSTEWVFSDNKQAEVRLLLNPKALIYHSVLVEKNGLIHSVLEGTDTFDSNWFWSDRVYDAFVLKTLPNRADSFSSAKEIISQLESLEPKQRDSLIAKEIIKGNFPSSMRNLQAIDVQITTPTGKAITAKYWVMPDYLSFGSDDNFLRYPLEPKTAQSVGDAFSCFLSTAKISDDVYRAAATKMVPHPMTEHREAFSTIITHDSIIESERAEILKNTRILGNSLIAGHKKDVVSTSQLFNTDKPNRVALYGWHKPDGLPIQNIYTGHVDWYIDYSHGYRLVWNYVLVNGQFMHVNEIFANPELRGILTYETESDYFRY